MSTSSLFFLSKIQRRELLDPFEALAELAKIAPATAASASEFKRRIPVVVAGLRAAFGDLTDHRFEASGAGAHAAFAARRALMRFQVYSLVEEGPPLEVIKGWEALTDRIGKSKHALEIAFSKGRGELHVKSWRVGDRHYADGVKIIKTMAPVRSL